MSEMELSAPMRELRGRLDALGVEWRDESDIHGGWHVERTKWGHHGAVASAAWGRVDAMGTTSPLTYGWPDLLECWPYMGARGEQPRAMTVDEILEVAS